MLLQSCTPDQITLPYEVEQRCIQLQEMCIAKNGMSLQIPPDLKMDWALFRGLRKRHKQGDFRQSTDEANAVQRIAWWTIMVHREFRNQPKIDPGFA